MWYSSNVKYDLLTSKIKGHTTPSQTILRFCVDEACFPLRFEKAVVVDIAAVVVSIVVIIIFVFQLLFDEK